MDEPIADQMKSRIIYEYPIYHTVLGIDYSNLYIYFRT